MEKVEYWKDIKGYEGLYKVSNFGNIKSYGYRKKERILKPEITKKSRCLVKLSKNGTTKKYQVHRLVAEHFIDNPYFYEEVNHLDENPLNNCVDNLEWCSKWYNICYSFEKHVIAINTCTGEKKFYNSVTETESDGYDKRNVSCCCHGSHKTHKDVTFKFTDDSLYVIGVDQSYTRTGITLMCDGVLIDMFSIDFDNCIDNTDKRNMIDKRLTKLIRLYRLDKRHVKCIVEQIRLFSQGKISQTYLLSTAALVGRIIDTMGLYNIPVYSVSTKSWKSQIVGTSKPLDNPYGINKEKYPTILYLKSKGLLNRLVEPYNGKGKKGIIPVKIDGEKVPCKINDDIADSYCICMYGFLPKSKQKLKLETF